MLTCAIVIDRVSCGIREAKVKEEEGDDEEERNEDKEEEEDENEDDEDKEVAEGASIQAEGAAKPKCIDASSTGENEEEEGRNGS